MIFVRIFIISVNILDYHINGIYFSIWHFSEADVWSSSWLAPASIPSSRTKRKMKSHNDAVVCGTIDVLVAPTSWKGIVQFLRKQNVRFDVR